MVRWGGDNDPGEGKLSWIGWLVIEAAVVYFGARL